MGFVIEFVRIFSLTFQLKIENEVLLAKQSTTRPLTAISVLDGITSLRIQSYKTFGNMLMYAACDAT